METSQPVELSLFCWNFFVFYRSEYFSTSMFKTVKIFFFIDFSITTLNESQRFKTETFYHFQTFYKKSTTALSLLDNRNEVSTYISTYL